MNSNTILKGIPFEDMKKYLEGQGYAVVKKPVIKTRLKPCPICGKMPIRINTDISMSYVCGEDKPHVFGAPVKHATMFNDGCLGPLIAEYKSKEKTDEQARRNWNDTVKGIKETIEDTVDIFS